MDYKTDLKVSPFDITNFFKDKEERDKELAEHISNLALDYRKNRITEIKRSYPNYTQEELETAIIADAFTRGYLQAITDYNINT